MKKPLMPVDEALKLILNRAETIVGHETVPLMDALGRVSSSDLFSSIHVPPCDNSAMDGYAVRFEDLPDENASPEEIRLINVSQRIPAGKMGSALKAGTAARIFTGAAIPSGADTVVMQEDVEVVGDAIKFIASVKSGQNIRPKGQDIAEGSGVVEKGRKLLPQDIGLLASVGITSVEVYKRLKVAVLSTGDELVEPGESLSEGQIYNSNRYTLAALLKSMGFEVIDGGIVADDLSATISQLEKLSAEADLIISSGGVSVGEEDHIKDAVASLGELNLWKLNIKPGKPVAFGHVRKVPFFGLPGNPSSVFVTFNLLAKPFLLRCQGQYDVAPNILAVKADFAWKKAGSRQEYLRAKVQGVGKDAKVCLYKNQSSGVLASTSWANALVVIPPNAIVEKEDFVEVILMSELLS